MNGVRPDIVRDLRCPVCAAPLSPEGGTVRCAVGHSFDVARQGYLNLSGGRAAAGDTAAMIAARAEFLAAGHYDFIGTALASAAARTVAADGLVVDLGAGTGHHTAAVLDALPGRLGLALDSSTYALRRAARAHPRLGAVACDGWRRLPVRDGAAALVLDVFAPRNGAEFRRILAPGGALLVVTPEPAHLRELVDALDLLAVDPDKDRRLDHALGAHFALVDSRVETRTLHLGPADVRRLVAMGPSARHTDPPPTDGLPATTTVTAAIRLSTYR